MKSLTKAILVPGALSYPTSYAVLYKCPTNIDSKVITLYISNLMTGNKTISIGVKQDSVLIPFIKDTTIAANSYLHIWGGYIVLESGDEVVVTATASDSGDVFSVFITVEEETKQSQTNSGTEPYLVP